MKLTSLGSAILAGVAGTLAMTALMYATPLMGLPPMDLLTALGGLVPLDISPYLVGGLIHLGVGVTLALLYAVVFEQILPGPRWVRGALFSLLPWVFAITLMGPAMAWIQATLNPAVEAQAAVNPCGVSKPANPCEVRPTGKAVNPCGAIAREAVNPAMLPGAQAPSPWFLATMSLMAHVAYGGVVGSVYRRKA